MRQILLCWDFFYSEWKVENKFVIKWLLILIKCPMDVSTMPGFCFDNCDILASFVSIIASTSVYRWCFPFDIVSYAKAVRITAFSRLPSTIFQLLHRYYSGIRLPVSLLPFSLSGRLTYHNLHRVVDDTGSPLFTWNPCIAWTVLSDTAEVCEISPYR